jgi:hypothetical protein
MTVPTFAGTATPGLYWLDEPLPAGYGIALVLAGDTPPAPSSLTLADSWTAHPGLYLMTAQRPTAAQEGDFAAAVRGVWAWMGPTARFAWLDPAGWPAHSGDPAGWAPQPIHVTQSPGAQTGTIEAPALLAFGRYTVVLSTGVTIGLAADGFTLTGGPPVPFALTTPEEHWLLTGPTATSGSPATAISFAGAAAGCVALDLALPQGGADYDRLDVGLRMSVDPGRVDHRAAGLLRSLRYPVFASLPAAGVALSGSFDPARPVDSSRTRLTYTAAVSHDSCYRGPLGHPVAVTPQPAGAAPGGLAFHHRPRSRHGVPDDDPLYLGPVGAFALSVGGSPANLACGTSGYEYFGLSAATGATVTFDPGQPADAQGLVGASGDVTLTKLATCPYAAVTPAGGATVQYFAQPRHSALHRIRQRGEASLTPYLTFLPVPAGQAAGTVAPYPMLPYGSAQGDGPLRERLEARVLAPRRREALTGLAPAIAEDDSPVVAVTPRGLRAGFDAGVTSWQSLQLASTGPGTNPPPLELLSIRDDLRNALLSNELFIVVADPAPLLANADLNYWVTDAALGDLRALPAATRPNAAVLSALATPAAQAPQAGRAAFLALLQRVLPTGWTQWQDVILRLCAYFELVIEGWRFRLSPTAWSSPPNPDKPMLMVVKMATSALRALAADPGSWTWPRVAGDTTHTAEVLRQIVEDADTRVEQATSGRPSPLENFVKRVLDDPSWNGVLFLNVPVPLEDLPAELRGLGAGIDAARFRAHHVGVSISPVVVDTVNRKLSLAPTPMFGLIDYQDPVDIHHTFDDFAFKVLALRVLFENSAIVDFSSRAELFVNRLLGDGVLLDPSEHYNNLVLEGHLQRTQGGDHYVFATTHASRFGSSSHVVDSIEVTVAQFATTSAGATVSSRFSLWGKLRFRRLDAIDLFSFGPVQPGPGAPVEDGWLAFSGLAVDMTFSADAPATTTAFTAKVSDMAFDPTASRARAESWFRRFPLQVTGLMRGERGDLLRDHGFLPVRTPLHQPALTEGWHALTFTVDLGTLGALAAEAGLVMTVALAWGPGADSPNVNVGLRLPGVQALGQLLPVEGVLGLGFQSIELRSPAAVTGGPSYVMDLKRFALHVLGWTLPPGQADLHLFGDPDVARQPVGGRRSAVGWYASYEKR